MIFRIFIRFEKKVKISINCRFIEKNTVDNDSKKVHSEKMSYGGQMQYPGPAPGMGAPPVRAPQPPPTQTSIQFMLDENCQLIQSIIDHHQQGTDPTLL